MPKPDAPAVTAYLGTNAASYPTGALEGALAAEASAQARICRTPELDADYPDDLAEALMRRVARNLAMRNLPLGIMADEMGPTRIGSTDPEVRRLEAPHRKLVKG